MRIVEDHADLERLDKQLDYVNNHIVVVGFLSEKNVDGVNVQKYAAWNEFGTINIRSRPFFRRATQTKKAKEKIENYIDTQISLIIQGKKTGNQALKAIGLYVVGQVQLSIKSMKKFNIYKNKESTIKKKGKNNPLIDSGSMIQSVSFEIRRK